MKKIIYIITITSLIMSNILMAQTDDFREKVTFGVKAGFNYSNVWDSEGEEFTSESKVGFAAGAFFQIPIMKYFGFQPGIMFSQKGFQGKGKILGGNYEFTRTTNFLDIPLLFTYKPMEMITFVGGPQYSYLMKQTDVFANAVTTIEQEQEFANEDIRNNTLCFTTGFDVNFEQLIFSTRLGWDFLNNNSDGSSSTPRYKNTWWQFTIGYRFD